MTQQQQSHQGELIQSTVTVHLLGKDRSFARQYTVFHRDETRARWTPWATDSQCSRFEVQFGVNVNRTWLMSSPRSGNTWTRYLIELSTGIFTTSIYEDKALFHKGYLGELENPKSGTAVLVKSHNDCGPKTSGDEDIILLLRHPKHSIISHYTFTQHKTSADKHVINFKPEKFNRAVFGQFFKNGLSRWKSLVNSCLTKAKRLLVIYYEDLKEDPVGNVRKMLNFLNYEVDEQRLACLAKTLDGPVKKNQSTTDFDPYTSQQKSQMEGAVESASLILQRLHYKPLGQ